MKVVDRAYSSASNPIALAALMAMPLSLAVIEVLCATPPWWRFDLKSFSLFERKIDPTTFPSITKHLRSSPFDSSMYS